MKKFAIALATFVSLGLAAPAFAQEKKVAKAIANFFMEFPPASRTGSPNYRSSNERAVNATPSGQRSVLAILGR